MNRHGIRRFRGDLETLGSASLCFHDMFAVQAAFGKGISCIDYEFGTVRDELIVDGIMVSRHQDDIVPGYLFSSDI